MVKQLTNILTVCLLLCISACGQTKTISAAVNQSSADTSYMPGFHLSKTIPGIFSLMEVDILNNIFVVTATGQLKKINLDGDSIAVYNDIKKYGNPSLIDVSNPLKILVYYKNFSTAVILDRFLAQRNIINFRKENLLSVQAVSTSYDNNLWIFDGQEFKLKKIDEYGKLISESNDLRQFISDVPLPESIFDNGLYVYLYDPQKGIYIFDYYGTLKKQLPYLGWQNANVWNGSIYGFSNNGRTLNTYEEKTAILRSYNIPANIAGDAIKFVNGKLVVLKKDRIEIYEQTTR